MSTHEMNEVPKEQKGKEPTKNTGGVSVKVRLKVNDGGISNNSKV